MPEIIDTRQRVPPKNKSSAIDGEQFQCVLTESDQKYLLDLTYKNIICAECGKDHSFKPNFEDVITSIDCIPELIPLFFQEDSRRNLSSSSSNGNRIRLSTLPDYKEGSGRRPS